MSWTSIAGAGIGALGSLAGARMSSSAARAYAREQAKMQKEFAQHGIRWKVSDAKAAGIHPLAAMGAQTIPFSPISTGDTSMGQGLADAGQDISRALYSTADRRQRAAEMKRMHERQQLQDHFNMERHYADLEGQKIQNQINATKLKQLQANTNPPFPGGGATAITGNPIDDYLYVPAEVTSRDSSSPSHEAGGARPGVQTFRIGSKGFGLNVDLPSEAASEPLESLGPILSPAYMGAHYLMTGFDKGRKFDKKNLERLKSLGRWIQRKFRRK